MQIDKSRLKVGLDRTGIASTHPAFEFDLCDYVGTKRTGGGRNQENNDFDSLSCEIDLYVPQDNNLFNRAYNETTVPSFDDSYVNGFTRANLSYIQSYNDGVFFYGTPTEESNTVGLGLIQVRVLDAAATNTASWRLDGGAKIDSTSGSHRPDPFYAAPVAEMTTYTLGYTWQEQAKSADPAFTDTLTAVWLTDAGTYLGETSVATTTYNTAGTAQAVSGTALSPAGAAYCVIASRSTYTYSTSVKGYRQFRWSKFLINKSGASYALDSLNTISPHAGTAVVAKYVGNQYNIATDYPKLLTNSGTDQAPAKAITEKPSWYVSPSWFFINSLTGPVSNHWLATGLTATYDTVTFLSGAQSLKVTTSASNQTLLWSPATTTYNLAVVPGQQYYFGSYIKNNNASTATVTPLIAHDDGTIIDTLSAITIAASQAFTFMASDVWTCPAGVYAVNINYKFAATGYSLNIDSGQFVSLSAEPWNNLVPQFNFQTMTSVDFNNLIVANGATSIQIVNDNSAVAPSGPQYLSLTKATGVTSASPILAKSSAAHNIYTQESRVYQISFNARLASAVSSCTVGIQYKFQNTTPASFTASATSALTTTWTPYTFLVTAPSLASAMCLVLSLNGPSGSAVTMWVDSLTVQHYPTTLDASSTVNAAGLSRTSIYTCDAAIANQGVTMDYSNWFINNSLYSYKEYSSGYTQTRFEADIISIGQNVPVGTTCQLVWKVVTVQGDALDSNGVGFSIGIPALDVAQTITLPSGTGSSVHVSSLAPNIPFASLVPQIVFTLPIGSAKFGYTFSNEYIGPDGYQANPEIHEKTIFYGEIDQIALALDNMPIASGPSYVRSQEVTITGKSAMTNFGGIQMNTPYVNSVLYANPLVYLPLNDSPQNNAVTELAGRLDITPSIQTWGKPNNWGITQDSAKCLAGTSEGGSYLFTGSGSNSAGQFINVSSNYYNGPFAASDGWCTELWFSHSTAITSGNFEIASYMGNLNGDSTGMFFELINVAGVDTLQFSGGHWGYTLAAPGVATDGKNHHIVVRSGNGAMDLWYDGVLVLSNALSIVSSVDVLYLGGVPSTIFPVNWWNGHIAHFALYDRLLGPDEIRDHYQLGKGLSGQDEIERINLVLQQADQKLYRPYVTDRNGYQPSGVSEMDYPRWSSNTSTLAECKAVSLSAGGYLFEHNGRGLIYENRQRRYNYTNYNNWSVTTVVPEAGTNIAQDATKVINSANITTAYGTHSANDRRSQKAYQLKQYNESDNRLSDNLVDAEFTEADHRAKWIVNTNKREFTWYDGFEFLGVGDNAIALVFGISINDLLTGDLATANSPNQGTLTQYVDSVAHSISIDGQSVTWSVVVTTSPAGNQQVYVIGDSTYGIIGTNNRISY